MAEGQILEHARFALAEEQAARLVAEASRRMALTELARERAARLEAEQDARHLEAELSAARAARDAAVAQGLEEERAWDTQIARPVETDDTASQAFAEVVPVSVTPSDATPEAASSAPLPGNPALAAGQAALARGDVEEARRLFRRLADEGMAEAALALGSTYDPVNAERMHAQVDRAQAKQWYRRAIELAQGATERQREQ
jgi:hypothetical protein